MTDAVGSGGMGEQPGEGALEAAEVQLDESGAASGAAPAWDPQGAAVPHDMEDPEDTELTYAEDGAAVGDGREG